MLAVFVGRDWNECKVDEVVEDVGWMERCGSKDCCLYFLLGGVFDASGAQAKRVVERAAYSSWAGLGGGPEATDLGPTKQTHGPNGICTLEICGFTKTALANSSLSTPSSPIIKEVCGNCRRVKRCPSGSQGAAIVASSLRAPRHRCAQDGRAEEPSVRHPLWLPEGHSLRSGRLLKANTSRVQIPEAAPPLQNLRTTQPSK